MASERMLQFVGREQSYPDKRSPEERARDFREIAERYAAPDADAQAARWEWEVRSELVRFVERVRDTGRAAEHARLEDAVVEAANAACWTWRRRTRKR